MPTDTIAHNLVIFNVQKKSPFGAIFSSQTTFLWGFQWFLRPFLNYVTYVADLDFGAFLTPVSTVSCYF
jgi:hypothetical protein